MTEKQQAENLCAALDSLIIGTQMALTDARKLTSQPHSGIAYKLQMVRQYLFDAKSELMDYDIPAMTSPRMPPPDDPQYSWAEVS